MRIDLNCDMGESFGAWRMGDDEKIMPEITSANIACGYHAGDPLVMARTAALARTHRVAVGAHPGFPDLLGFGRRDLDTLPGETKNYLIYQIGALAAIAKVAGVRLQHVKPHGALYNLAARNESTAREVIDAVRAYDAGLILVAPAGSLSAQMAAAAGLPVALEAFADRAYLSDGRLAPRTMEGAVIHDPDEVGRRVIKLVETGTLLAIDGKEIEIKAHTLCVHGDTPGAWKLARAVRQALEEAGISVVPMAELL
jgi:UPF0271 protein